jgi:hypothetical protein
MIPDILSSTFVANLTVPYIIEATGAFLITLALASFLFRFFRYLMRGLERAEELAERNYQAQEHLSLMVTAVQAGLIKKIATDNKIVIDDEIKEFPEMIDADTELAAKMKQRLQKKILKL